MPITRPAIFFDRDGVLNECRVVNGKPYPPVDVASLVIAPDAAVILARLRKLGFSLVCVTNQPDVARGTSTLESVLAINEKVKASLGLDALYVCLHDNHHACSCRKPAPGMLLQAARDLALDMGQSFMIGDRAGDIAAGRSAGCGTIHLFRGYSEAKPDPPADYTCTTLREAAAWIENAVSASHGE